MTGVVILLNETLLLAKTCGAVISIINNHEQCLVTDSLKLKFILIQTGSSNPCRQAIQTYLTALPAI